MRRTTTLVGVLLAVMLGSFAARLAKPMAPARARSEAPLRIRRASPFRASLSPSSHRRCKVSAPRCRLAMARILSSGCLPAATR